DALPILGERHHHDYKSRGKGREKQERPANRPLFRSRGLSNAVQNSGAKRHWWCGQGKGAEQTPLPSVGIGRIPALGALPHMLLKVELLLGIQLGPTSQHLFEVFVSVH